MNTPYDIPQWDYLEIKNQCKLRDLDERLNADITSGLREKLRETINKEQSLDLQVFARKGKGKSTLALKIMEERLLMKYGDDYSPEDHFDLTTIHFTTESLEKWFRENPEKARDTCVLLDEQVANYGVGSYINIQKLSTYSETLRKRKVNFFFASPSGRYMGQFQYDFMLQPIALTSKAKGYGTVLMSGVFTKENILIGSMFSSLPTKYVMKEYDKVKELALDDFTTLELNMADKYNDVVEHIIQKYKMHEWFEKINEYRQFTKDEQKDVTKPPMLTKKAIQSLLLLEKYRYSLTEQDVIADLVLLTLQGVIGKEREDIEL